MDTDEKVRIPKRSCTTNTTRHVFAMKVGDLVKLKKHRQHPNSELLGIVINCSLAVPGAVKVLLLKKRKIVSTLKTNVIVINESR